MGGQGSSPGAVSGWGQSVVRAAGTGRPARTARESCSVRLLPADPCGPPPTAAHSASGRRTAGSSAAYIPSQPSKHTLPSTPSPSQSQSLPVQSSPFLSDRPDTASKFSPSHHQPRPTQPDKKLRRVAPDDPLRILASPVFISDSRCLPLLLLPPLSQSRQHPSFAHPTLPCVAQVPAPANRATRPPPPILMAP